MKAKLSDEEIDNRIAKFRKVVRYRKIAGIALAVVGLAVLAFGLLTPRGFFLIINGAFCLGYGLFMHWQAAKYEKQL